MKRGFLIFSALVATLVASTAHAQEHTAPVLRLTLEDALKIALTESPTVKIADQTVLKTEYAKKGAYGQLFPQIDATGSYSRTIKKQAMYMDMGTGTPNKIEVGMDNSWSGGFSASMPIIAPELWKSLKLSVLDVELAIEQARASRIDMVEQVSQAYFQIMLAEAAYVVYKDAYDNAAENYKNIKQKFNVGSISEFELLRADVTLKNAEPNMYSAENTIAISKWFLKALLAMDLATEIECVGSLSDYETILSYSKQDVSLVDNSDLKQLDIQEQMLQKTLELRRAAYYPTLSAAFNFNFMSMNNNFKIRNYMWTPYSTVGVNLSIPIFAGGKRRQSVRQAKVDLSNLELQRESIERNLQVQLYQYESDMNTCIKQHNAAQSSVGQAEKSYNIAVRRFEIGNGTQLEINDSQLALTQSRLTLVQSIYNYMVAMISFEKLTGKYDALTEYYSAIEEE